MSILLDQCPQGTTFLSTCSPAAYSWLSPPAIVNIVRNLFTAVSSLRYQKQT